MRKRRQRSHDLNPLPRPSPSSSQSVLHASPHLAPLLLLLAVATLALLLPLCVFLGCQAEFAADVVPWTPRGFVLIARRTFAAFAANADTGKVEGKDL
jgi:hypothetical protein